MQRLWVVVVIALVGCEEPLVLGRSKPAGQGEAKRVEPPGPTRVAPDRVGRPDPGSALVQAPPDAAVQAPAAVTVFEVYSPMSMTLAGDTLMWTDPKGSLWSMPASGGKPTELSHQHLPGRPMFMNLATHAGAVIASRQGDLVRVDVPEGPLVPLGLELGEDSLLEMVSDGTALYATSYEQRSAIYKIVDGKKTKLLDHRSASIEVRGGTLYALSYSTGTLVAVKTSGGTPRTIARGLPKPTGFDVDDTSAYAWCEKDATLRKIDLKTGKITVLESKDLGNSDVVVADGDWVYLHTWLGPNQSKSLRVAKDGSRTEVLADELTAPYDIAIDDQWVFVSERDQNRILRFKKSEIVAL
ncbi:MAG TPA: DUF5050 domain-containing protein [Kofleriaceae bacterium]